MKNIMVLLALVVLLFSCEPTLDKYCRFIKDFSVEGKNRITDKKLSANDTVVASNFSIGFSIQHSTYKCQIGQDSYSESEYIDFNYDTITKIVIQSNQDFNLSSPAGSDLSEYFTMPDYTWYQSVLKKKSVPNLNLNLIQAPAWTKTHTFKVTLSISGKSDRTHEVMPITILN
jgi:hypothetical protein